MKLKQLLPLLLLSILSSAVFAQSENPFVSIGKKGTVLTLTKGQYSETFDADSIQQIGSSLINLHTMKVVKLLTDEESKKRLEGEKHSRFLSVDPMASSFAWNSPYSYAENDVIRAVDLDGREKFIITDGDEPGTVVIQIVNFEKRPAAFIGGKMPGTFSVEDHRKEATYKGEAYQFPIESIQALYGSTFINDAGVVYQKGDARKAKIAQEELGIDPSSKVYNTPSRIAMDAKNSTLQEKQVIYAAAFPAGLAEVKFEQKYELVENKKQAISPLDTKTGSFGNGKTSVTRNYLAPKSDGVVNVSLLVGDGNSITNSFTVLDAKGNQLASFQSSSTQHSTTLNFSVPSGSKFFVVVGGSATDKADNYALTGSASTETKTSYLAPVKDK